MPSRFIRWAHPGLRLVVEIPVDAPVRIAQLDPATSATSVTETTVERGYTERLQPMVEVLVLGEGNALANVRFTHTNVGSRLRYVDDVESSHEGWRTWRIHQRDLVTGLQVTTVFRSATDVPAVQTWTEVVNQGARSVVLQMVSSLATGALMEPGDLADDLSLMRGRSEWCGEGRWATLPLRGADGLADIDTGLHDHDGRGTLATASRSTWSSGEYLPTGILVNGRTGSAWSWQVEHNGAWHWEVDSRRDAPNAFALVVTGPNDADHQWSTRLAPAGSFTSVPVSVAVSDDGYEGALAALTAQRRAIRRKRPVDASLPVIFNDYMNTLMGDPTTAKLLPLVDAAAAAGAEYFCVDAGWYDDGGHWWDSVGEWLPSTGRFPDGGLDRVLDHIRARGMQAGVWLEPEVVGVRSPMADKLPDEAFLQRFGERVVEHSRFLLDLRHPAAREHLDSVVDRLVDDHGVRYFKLDYNVTPGAGTDRDALSPGDGLLEHNRAHLGWLDGILDRHPDVIFENCASGAMRMDYAMMSRLDLQSTSDQQDPRLYAAIAAAAPASLLPEQAGNWAYPQPGMSDEELAFAMVNGLVGRLYLSGRIDAMNAHELGLVREGVAAYQEVREHLCDTTPFWPLALPGWFDDVVAMGLCFGSSAYLAVWSRAETPGRSAPVTLPLPFWQGRAVGVATHYPRSLPSWTPTWDRSTGELTVLPSAGGPGARLFRLDMHPS